MWDWIIWGNQGLKIILKGNFNIFFIIWIFIYYNFFKNFGFMSSHEKLKAQNMSYLICI